MASGQERRKSHRRPILDSFSMFVVVPTKGPYRLPVHDVSDSGLGFDFDTEGEDTSLFSVKQGDQFEIHLYLNQSLHIPLNGKVMRVVDDEGTRRLGVELTKTSTAGHKAFMSFLQMIDDLSSSGVVVVDDNPA